MKDGNTFRPLGFGEPVATEGAGDVARLQEENAQLAAQVRALSRKNMKLFAAQEQLNQQRRVYERLAAVSRRINEDFRLDSIAGTVTTFVVHQLNLERAVFLAPDGEALRAVAIDGTYDDELGADVRRLSLPLADLPGTLFEDRRSVVAPLAQAEATGHVWRAVRAALRIDDLVVAPLLDASARVLGLLVAGNTTKRAKFHTPIIDQNLAAALDTLGSHTSIALHNAELYAALVAERNALEGKVSERTRELSEANAGLKRLDRLKSEFFANVSHELRTPLALSIGPLEHVLRAETMAAPVRQTLETVLHNQARLMNLINDLLDFSRLEAGVDRPRPARVVLQEHLTRYVATFEGAASARAIRLERRIPPEPITIYFDPRKLERVLVNLLSNAFKFTPDGGTISVEIEPRADAVRLIVSDTGIGIPASEHERIFDRFSQVDSSERRRFSGTGIGLAMVKEYVELHGGRITLESEEGRGARFSVELRLGRDHLDPRDVDDGSADAEPTIDPFRELEVSLSTRRVSTPPPAAMEAIEPAPSEERATVLVAEDNPEMRRFLSQLLAEHYDVVVAVDGRDARAKLEAGLKPALVLSDVMMPHMSGPELCGFVKGTPALSRTPVVLITAKVDTATKLESLDYGADDYLVKPFGTAELLCRLRNLIRFRRHERHLAKIEAQLEKDEELVANVQALFFPREKELETRHFTLARFSKPADRVGGDWWWYGFEREGRLTLLVGDVTGHGVPAAMLTATVATAVRSENARHGGGATAAALMRAVSAELGITTGGQYLMSMIGMTIDFDTRELRAVGAGAPPALVLRRDGSVDRLSARGMPLGDEQFAAVERSMGIERGDRILSFTDGVVDLFEQARPRGLRGLERALIATRGLSATRARDAIGERLAAVLGDSRSSDDATFVVVDVR